MTFINKIYSKLIKGNNNTLNNGIQNNNKNL